MTEKQKQAIRVLNNIRAVSKALSENDYFLLLEFVVEQQPLTYVTTPFVQTNPQPLDPVYLKSGEVACTTSEPTMQGESASTGLSYGDRLIMENKSPI